MRLFKIKNKYMYNSQNNDYKPNGNHTYAVYKDKKTGKYRAIQLTHLFETKKVAQIEKGQLLIENFNYFKYPTGVKNNYYDKDINGNILDFGKNTKHLYIGNVPSGHAKRIILFANKRHR